MVSFNIVLFVISFVVFQLSTAETIAPIWLSPLNATNVGPASVPRGEWMNITIGYGARSSNFVVQVDSKGKIWILGGYGYAIYETGATTGYVSQFYPNAVWNYDPKTDLYRWVAGSADSPDTQLPPNYTEFGVPDANAFPGSMGLGAYAIDHADNIWIYGGSNEGSPNPNMFWRFNTTSFEFTNFCVNDTVLPVVDKIGVPSADNYPGRLEGASLLVDSHNNLWLLGGNRYYSLNDFWYNVVINEVWHFNTTSLMWTFVWGQLNEAVALDYENKTWNGRYLAAASIDSEDRIWLFGGQNIINIKEYANWGDMWSFDTKTLTWSVEYGNETSADTTGSVAVPDDFDINNYPPSRLSAGMVDRQDGTLLVGGGSLSNDYWLYNKTSKLWKLVYGNITHTGEILPTEFTHYRAPGSYLGQRSNFAVSGGIHNRGNLVFCGGDDAYMSWFGDVWVFPQDQCVGANNDCDVNAVCTSSNDYFSHTCTCKEGYVGDGKTCTLSPVSSPSDSSNNPSSNGTPNNNGTPSKSPSSKVSDASAMTSCSLLVYLASMLVLPLL